jgi:cation transport protein ChaC
MTVEDKPLWVLGYGSLIFKPPPHARYVIPGVIYGFARRFWQSSSDHRGTPEQKGRVVTLVPHKNISEHETIMEDVLKYDSTLRRGFRKSDLRVWACAYYIPAEKAKEVSEYLDVREQDGYTVHEIPFLLHHDPDVHNQDELKHAIKELPVDQKTGKHILTSTVYIGTIDNESFVGPEDLQDTAKIISETRGPSGENWEYLEKLYYSLRDLDKNGKDEYLEALVHEVLRIKEQRLLSH